MDTTKRFAIGENQVPLAPCSQASQASRKHLKIEKPQEYIQQARLSERAATSWSTCASGLSAVRTATRDMSGVAISGADREPLRILKLDEDVVNRIAAGEVGYKFVLLFKPRAVSGSSSSKAVHNPTSIIPMPYNRCCT